MKKALQFFAFLSTGLFIFYLVYQSQNTAYQAQCLQDGIAAADCNLVEKLISDFGRVDYLWIFVVIVAFALSNAFRAKRWQMQFAAMGHDNVQFKNTFWSIHLGYFANLGFPRLGEVVRAGMISKYDAVPMEKSVGSLVVDRLADFVCLLIFVALTFLVEFDTLYDFIFGKKDVATGVSENSNSWLANLFYAGVTLGVVALVIFFIFRKKIEASKFYQFFIVKLKGFWDGILSIKNLDNPLLFSALSIGIWLMFYLQCLFTLWAFPPTAHLGVQPALMIFILGTLGFIIPAPGGMGSYHALAIAGLALYNVEGTDAFSFANISFFSVQIFYNLIAGLLALFLLPRMNRK